MVGPSGHNGVVARAVRGHTRAQPIVSWMVAQDVSKGRQDTEARAVVEIVQVPKRNGGKIYHLSAINYLSNNLSAKEHSRRLIERENIKVEKTKECNMS